MPFTDWLCRLLRRRRQQKRENRKERVHDDDDWDYLFIVDNDNKEKRKRVDEWKQERVHWELHDKKLFYKAHLIAS